MTDRIRTNRDEYFIAVTKLYNFIESELPILHKELAKYKSIYRLSLIIDYPNYRATPLRSEFDHKEWIEGTKQVEELHQYIKDNRELEAFWIL